MALSPTHWIWVYLVLMTGFLIAGSRRQGRFDPLSAQVLFNLPTALYALGGAMNYYWLDVPLLELNYTVTVANFEDLLPIAVLALCAFNVGYLLMPGRRVAVHMPPLDLASDHERVVMQWAFAAMLASAALMIVGFGSFGFSTVFGNPYGSVAMSGQSLIHFGMFVEAGIAVVAAYLYRRRLWRSPLAASFLLLIVAYATFIVLIGKRSPLLYLFLIFAVDRHAFGSRVSLRLAGATGVALASVFAIMEVGRGSQERTFASMVDHVSYVASSSSEFADWTGWPARFLSQGDLLGTLGVMMDRLPDIGFQQGWTYLEAVARLAPGFLSRGLFSGGLSTLVGDNLALFYLAEAYLNFGFAGFVVVPAVLGALLRVLDEWKWANPASLLVVASFAVIAGSITYLPRLDLGSVLKGVVYPPLFLVALRELSHKHVMLMRPIPAVRRSWSTVRPSRFRRPLFPR